MVGKGPPDPGGIAVYLREVLRDGISNTYDFELLNLTRPGAQEGGRLTVRNIVRTLQDAVRLWRCSHGKDIVHIHTALVPHVTLLRAGILAATATLRRIPVIVHVHGGRVEPWLVTRGRRWLVKACLSPAERVVTVSSGGLRKLKHVQRRDKVILIENGIDTSLFGMADANNDPPRVLFVGGLTPRKGVVDLIQASTVLAERGVAHDLLLAGGTPNEGPEAEADVRRAASAAVTFLGTRPHEDMPALYRGVDLFCLPSWWEAMPFSLLEAMASGLPVVATGVGDIPRVMEDGVTGYVVPPRDPSRLAAALEHLLRDGELRRRFGAAGRRRVERLFSAENVRDQLARVYEELTTA